MRIAFVSPTLEAGVDGIADYTKLLADYLEKQGETCEIFAVKQWKLPMERQRYLAHLSHLKQGITSFRPDVISWQYDGNQFSPRRIFPWNDIPDLHDICPRVHMMIHETWEGNYHGDPLAKKIKGFFQRQSFKGAIGRMRPDLIHTSIDLYRSMLRGQGIQAKLLPMFSNILLNPLGTPQLCYRTEIWNLVFFGGVYPFSRFEDLIEKLEKLDRRCVFHHVGHLRDSSNWDHFKSLIANRHEWIEHGRCTDQEVSIILSSCHFGISTMPLVLLGKSTVYCAFREHGLPIIDIRLPLTPKNYIEPCTPDRANLIALDELPDVADQIQRHPPSRLLEQTGRLFQQETRALLGPAIH